MAALGKIDRPGSFCASGTASPVLPGLEVQGVAEVGLPLSKSQAAELKRVCRQAPYGKGEQTLVDTDVRRVWQLDADRFKLTNPEWQNFLKATISTIQTELGLEEQKLEPHLYNLLLYKKGRFFKPHRDGERLERMVATLVVVLPSAHEGGDLIVRHEGVEQVIPMGGADNLTEIQVPAILRLESWLAKLDDVSCPAVKKWLVACLAELHSVWTTRRKNRRIGVARRRFRANARFAPSSASF